ncbi:single-stranded DNA-binding protein, partial [bacterium]
EICGEWLKKGKKIYIEGRIQTRSYDDKNTGTKKYITEIVADNMIMLDYKSAPENGGHAPLPETPSSTAGGGGGGKEEDDLPF